MPLPFANTSVFAVPKSIARSEESRLKTERRVYPVLLITGADSGFHFEYRENYEVYISPLARVLVGPWRMPVHRRTVREAM